MFQGFSFFMTLWEREVRKVSKREMARERGDRESERARERELI